STRRAATILPRTGTRSHGRRNGSRVAERRDPDRAAADCDAGVPAASFAFLRPSAAVTLLSVNVNKIAVLRNSRGHGVPDPVIAARAALDAGCHGITVHPRPDQRHVRADDVDRIAAVIGAAE